MLDLTTIRKDTPGVNHVVHLNNAGAALMPRQVMNATAEYLDHEFKHGGYETAAHFQDNIQAFYRESARLLNCREDEIAFTDSATTSWQRVFFSLPWKDGDEIITGNAEYASNYLAFIRLGKLFDIKVHVAKDNEWGLTDPNSISELINARTKLIAITHMPTISGLVNDVEAIGEIAFYHNIYYLVDACQSIGHCPLDVQKIKCDFLSATGRKYLRAPRGTGLLYVRKEAMENLEPMSIDLHSSQWSQRNEYKLRNNALRFETFECNYGAKVGLAEAIRYQNDLGIEGTWQRIGELAEYLRDGISKTEGFKVADRGQQKSGIVTFTSEKIPPFDLMKQSVDHKFNITAGSVFNSRLYMEANNLDQVVRASVHYYNTKEEIDGFVEFLRKLG